MDFSRMSDWLQVVGQFGVIASLVFVGLQMKQEKEIALAATYQERATATVETNASAAANPTFLGAMTKIYANQAQSLTAEEEIALNYQAGNNMILFESNHFQYLSGFLTEEHWQRNLAELKCFFELPFHRAALDSWEFRESFQSVLEDALRQAIYSPDGCWGIEFD